MPSGQSKSSPSGSVTGVQREVTFDPASIGAATTGITTGACPGAQVGDVVTASPRTALEAGLVVSYLRVTATDQIALVLGNITAGAIDSASRVWDVRLERVAPT